MRKPAKDAMMSFVAKTAQTYDPDPAHNETVTTVALALFDGLRALHKYGTEERRLLEIAGRLHDIGWSQVVSGKHHKWSRDLILKLDIPGLTEHNRFLCALIARYHTKALPDASQHRQFASLDPDRRDLLEWLAGILRVSDGLDCGHTHAVGNVSCDIGDKAITIHLKAKGDCRMEIQGARRKQDLLARKTGMRIDYRC